MTGLSLIAQASSYNYEYDYTTASDTASISPAAFVVVLLLVLVIGILMYVINAYFLGRIFKKAGVESWKAWVPVYNNWVMLELGGQQGYWAIFALIPFVNIVAAVFTFIAMYHIGLRLGKDGAFVLLAIFLPIVWVIWLALDNSTWDGAGMQANQNPTNSNPSPHLPTSANTPSNNADTPAPKV